MFAAGVVLLPGDHLTFQSNGGGGIGNPLERDPELVRTDVIDGYLSLGVARDIYGVVIDVIDEDTLDCRVDERATLELRKQRRKRPWKRGLGPWEVHPFGDRIEA
jgi:N-methylhydantoinase B